MFQTQVSFCLASRLRMFKHCAFHDHFGHGELLTGGGGLNPKTHGRECKDNKFQVKNLLKLFVGLQTEIHKKLFRQQRKHCDMGVEC